MATPVSAQDKIDAGVPMPESANVPPPTAKDLGSMAAPSAQPAPAPAPAPVAAAPAAATPDSALTDRLRDAVAKAERLGLRKSEREVMTAFYKDRNYAPLWLTNGTANDKAKAAATYLSTVDRDGLDPSEYSTPDFKAATDADALADAEVKMTAAVLTYARHALNGRVAWSRISADIYYTGPSIETPAVLAKLGSSNDVADTLDSFEPQALQYKALRKALADVRANGHKKEEKAELPKVQVAEGKILRPGMKDERVLALRQRLELPDKENTTYDKVASDGVKQFQKDNGLNADGNLGTNTVKALNGQKPETVKLGDPVDTIIVNLERWRWMPRILGDPYVVVNIPDYRLTLYKDEKIYWTTKIVVGQPGKPTPLIS
ncbi:MAG: peptidoglycan-binding protein, partial [Pseudolabrys sp.]|nr:peptidoglycan-binding protein [Pseudolabrys sp.]